MKKETICRIIAVLMILVMTFQKLEVSVFANEDQNSYVVVNNEGKSSKTAVIRGTTEPSYIDKYGNTYLSITSEEFFDAGYEYGDIVKIKILGKKYRLPVVSSYTDVDSGKPALLAREDKQYIWLAVNMGSFAATYGIGTKTTLEDGTVEWNYPEGVSGPVKVSVWMKKKGGYADQYAIHQLTSSIERSDFPDLTDEEYANFREVNTTGMGFGILYRTSSPIDPANNRNMYADRALKDAGVTVILNLSDSQESVKEYEGFSKTYYSTVKSLALPLNVDYQSEDFEQKLAEGLRFLADTPGVYGINCKSGKDRVGFLAALLECLMGADYYEVVDDYMISYYNYNGVKNDDPAYEAIIKGNIEKTLKSIFTFSKKDKKKNLNTRDLSKCAVKYLKKIGLTDTEIKRLKINLSQSVDMIEKNVPIRAQGRKLGTIKLKFYCEEPNIPYVGIKSFYDFLGYDISSRTDDLGRTVLTNENGIEVVLDTESGTLTTDNWVYFNEIEISKTDSDSFMAKNRYWFTHNLCLDYKETGKKAVFDFKKYGLKMYRDTQDVYMSLSLIASLRQEETSYVLGWNGRNVFIDAVQDYDRIKINDFPIIKNAIYRMTRPQDIIDETFKELCFIFEYFYGHPSSVLLAESIKEKGLCQSLMDLGKEGEALIKGLQSTDTVEYYLSMMKLFWEYLDDSGHTLLSDITYNILYEISSLMDYDDYNYITSIIYNSDLYKKYDLIDQILLEGDSVWGDNTYREFDNTAFIRLINFTYDEEGWENYFNAKGELPMDAAGITVRGLRKASENPKIDNVIFDLSVNYGGDIPVLGFIKDITTGNNVMLYYNELNDFTPTLMIESDTNLDGTIDDEDKRIYDRFNYGVLTSKAAYSCGNDFPIMMQENGAVVIGEPSGGGSCNVMDITQPDGTTFCMSCLTGILLQEDGQDAENGCKVDVPIEHKETIDADGNIIYDYSAYYDFEKLDQIMDEWF